MRAPKEGANKTYTPEQTLTGARVGAGAAAVPMTVAVPAVGPNKEIFNVLLDLLPNGPAVVMPPPPSMTLLGQLYMHLL